MDWFKKHADTLAVISSIVASMLWMNGKFNELEGNLKEITFLLEKNKPS